MTDGKRYFFCGIGGSGMLPLALIARARGSEVWGSDRSLDAGRLSDKFAWLESQGIRLFAQDGSGIQSSNQIIVASAAIEDNVPDIASAKAQGCERITRAELNAALFNAADLRIGVGGTSGKSTVTGMIGWILSRAGLPAAKASKDSVGKAPTVMNGAVMRNFANDTNPFASALVGSDAAYVSEVDESDGSIALYAPSVAVVTNISLDHKSLEELRRLFGDFAGKAGTAVINADDPESAPLLSPSPSEEGLGWGLSTGPALSGQAPPPTPPLKGRGVVSFGLARTAHIRASDFVALADGCRFTLHADGTHHAVRLNMPGRHNVSNALAAVAATRAAGVPMADAVAALADFAGLARRYEVIGTANGITVIDDFAHNPDKVAATLAAVATLPGRALLFFQPHGYGPLRQMGKELAASFAAGMRDGDRLWVCDPVYFGGTVDRSVGSAEFVADIVASGGDAVHLPMREQCADAIRIEAKSGDRILILGARDDTLTQFASALVKNIGKI